MSGDGDSADGQLRLEIAERMLKWHAEAMGRMIELSSPSDLCVDYLPPAVTGPDLTLKAEECFFPPSHPGRQLLQGVRRDGAGNVDRATVGLRPQNRAQPHAAGDLAIRRSDHAAVAALHRDDRHACRISQRHCAARGGVILQPHHGQDRRQSQRSCAACHRL